MSARVLVVDDDRALCEMLVRALSKQGYEVVSTVDATEALALAMASGLDAIVTDLNMTGMNGLELCERIVANRPDVPVMILSGLPQLPAGARASYDVFMSKTDPTFRLVKEVQRLVEFSGQKGEGGSASLRKRFLAAAGVAIRNEKGKIEFFRIGGRAHKKIK